MQCCNIHAISSDVLYINKGQLWPQAAWQTRLHLVLMRMHRCQIRITHVNRAGKSVIQLA